jgi:hypothetical protein
MDEHTVGDESQSDPNVAITPTSLKKLDAIAEVTLNTQLDVLDYAIELARKKLPPTPKPAGSTTRRRGQS